MADFAFVDDAELARQCIRASTDRPDRGELAIRGAMVAALAAVHAQLATHRDRQRLNQTQKVWPACWLLLQGHAKVYDGLGHSMVGSE